MIRAVWTRIVSCLFCDVQGNVMSLRTTILCTWPPKSCVKGHMRSCLMLWSLCTQFSHIEAPLVFFACEISVSFITRIVSPEFVIRLFPNAGTHGDGPNIPTRVSPISVVDSCVVISRNRHWPDCCGRGPEECPWSVSIAWTTTQTARRHFSKRARL